MKIIDCKSAKFMDKFGQDESPDIAKKNFEKRIWDLDLVTMQEILFKRRFFDY